MSQEQRPPVWPEEGSTKDYLGEESTPRRERKPPIPIPTQRAAPAKTPSDEDEEYQRIREEAARDRGQSRPMGADPTKWKRQRSTPHAGHARTAEEVEAEHFLQSHPRPEAVKRNIARGRAKAKKPKGVNPPWR